MNYTYIPLIIAAICIPQMSIAGVCNDLNESQCVDRRAELEAERQARLVDDDPASTWQRAPWGRKFTYHSQNEGMTADEERAMFASEDERNGY